MPGRERAHAKLNDGVVRDCVRKEAAHICCLRHAALAKVGRQHDSLFAGGERHEERQLGAWHEQRARSVAHGQQAMRRRNQRQSLRP
jgi:hypothetical protein